LHPLAAFSFSSNDTAPTAIYTLSLHDALPISTDGCPEGAGRAVGPARGRPAPPRRAAQGGRADAGGGAQGPLRGQGPLGVGAARSEEHTSELQSRGHLVCRLLLEKKKS